MRRSFPVVTTVYIPSDDNFIFIIVIIVYKLSPKVLSGLIQKAFGIRLSRKIRKHKFVAAKV